MNKLTTKEFIEKASLKHDNKYDYSKTIYVKSQENVCIICTEHGEFWQTPTKHLNGQGCYKCAKEKKHLTLDFYLPDYNIAIECQGEQHFHSVDFSGINEERARNEFDNCVGRDKRKSNKCNVNGVRLLYFTKKKFIKNGNNVIDGEYFFNPKDITMILNDDFDIYKKETNI